MKTLAIVETSDGVRHNSLAEAKRHAENRYGEALSQLARLLADAQGKYVPMIEILDKNHNYLAKILHCRTDKEMEAPDAKPKRMFRVLDSTGLPMNVRFCGQVAEYIREGSIPGTTLLHQPAFDNSGEPRSGLMTLDDGRIEEIL